jgi:hypothetical protein
MRVRLFCPSAAAAGSLPTVFIGVPLSFSESGSFGRLFFVACIHPLAPKARDAPNGHRRMFLLLIAPRRFLGGSSNGFLEKKESRGIDGSIKNGFRPIHD